MEIWFIGGREGSAAACPVKNKKHSRGATRYRGRKAPTTGDKLNGIYGHGARLLTPLLRKLFFGSVSKVEEMFEL